MEIPLNVMGLMLRDNFKIDLIVWKSENVFDENKFSFNFKIDLIVWKLSTR